MFVNYSRQRKEWIRREGKSISIPTIVPHTEVVAIFVEKVVIFGHKVLEQPDHSLLSFFVDFARVLLSLVSRC